jgi:hypothetical protein
MATIFARSIYLRAAAITPDGGTLFVVGTSGVFVQPSPP